MHDFLSKELSLYTLTDDSILETKAASTTTAVSCEAKRQRATCPTVDVPRRAVSATVRSYHCTIIVS